ncbi:MAG: phosphatidylglycerophosphatase A [Candidatus Stahlbacteria bacterium]|nr:MAG: phosphatidylglycerophosphatase A [Candidatus Stahlbacteria bacterium]
MGRKISKEEKIDFIKKILATGFFLGYIRIAPATFSCLISIVIWYFLFPYKLVYILVVIILFFTGVKVSNDLTKTWGKDPHKIVIDEYACLLIPLYFIPQRILPLAITFVLFRIFDIIKPWPIRKLEDLPGGWGVMLDDLGAAIYTTVVILIIMALVKL